MIAVTRKECGEWAPAYIGRAFTGYNVGPHAKADAVFEYEAKCLSAGIGSARQLDDWLQTGMLSKASFAACVRDANGALPEAEGGNPWFIVRVQMCAIHYLQAN